VRELVRRALSSWYVWRGYFLSYRRS